MRLLLDTHALIWWLATDASLSHEARAAIADRNNEILVSAVSAFEVTTKWRLGKLPEAALLAQDFADEVIREGFGFLPITVEHGVVAGQLHGAHRDPFDRLLMAQSLVDGLTLVSNERVFDGFGVSRLW